MSVLSEIKRRFSRTTEPKTIDEQRLPAREMTPYASREEFCWIFVKDLGNLYLLSLLLTGDHPTAEDCFLHGFEDTLKGLPVFKERAQTWARRTIIQRAIQMVRPRPTNGSVSSTTSSGSMSPALRHPAEIANVFELPQFERFVFVISVLERYSCHECALLLACSRGDVLVARTGALQRIAEAAEDSEKQYPSVKSRRA